MFSVQKVLRVSRCIAPRYIRHFQQTTFNLLNENDSDCQNDKIKIYSQKIAGTKLTLEESDFEEKFVKGSGPGGSKVNKTRNCVELIHKETGIVVQCHETRTLEENRKLARIRLLERLRYKFTPTESEVHKKISEKKKRKGDAQRRRALKEDAIKNRVDL